MNHFRKLTEGCRPQRACSKRWWKLSLTGMKQFLLVLLGVCMGFLSARAQPYGNEWIDFNKTYYKFPVREARFFRIPLTTLATYGLQNVPAEQFQLWRDGAEVPVYTSAVTGPLPTAGYIEFYGTPNSGAGETELFSNPAWQTHPERSFFLDTAWYFLTVNPAGPNKRFTQAVNNVNTTTLPPDSFYMETLRPLASSTIINGGMPRVVGTDEIRSSIWDKGESISSNRFDFYTTIQFNLTGLRAFLNGPPLRIQYQVAGANTAERNAILKLNNQPFDSIFVSNYDMTGKTLTGIPVSNLSGDTINFKFNTNNSSIIDNVVVTQFYFTYPRTFYSTVQPPLFINLPANTNGNHIRLKGLPNGTFLPVLYDLKQLKRYTGVIKADSSLFAIEPSSTERTIIIGTQNPSHARTVTAMKEVKFRNFNLPQNQGDYLMITHYFLRMDGDPVETYRAYRNSSIGGGYNAHIYDIDELAEQFSYGVRKNPLAIRRFILFAIDRFALKPKMVFIIGRGNTYPGYFRAGQASREFMNMVPTFGSPASDNLLASRSNLIPYPEIPIGRLSAVNAGEVKVYLDKIISFEALQRKKPALPTDNEWRKRILHLVGGDDAFLADSILWRYMNNFADIIKLPSPGAIVDQFKRANNPSFAGQVKYVEERISAGTGLITYFGHSSSSSIDFNLGSPDMYTNSDGRFPVFLANGCRAGNIFDYTTTRLSARETTISDNFIFAPNKGAIAFISNSDLGSINFQNLLTREWYTAFSTKKFGKTIGEIQQEALKIAWSRTANSNAGNQFVNRCNIEQNILHADPAIVPFTEGLPDFAVEASYLGTNPQKVLTELDSVGVKLHYFNLGTAVNDSVLITLEREMPDGTTKQLYRQKHGKIYNRDSIMLTIGLKGLFEEGPGYIVARIDPANDWQERDKDNNVAVIPFNLQRAHILPVSPANFAILSNPVVVLQGSTTNPLDKPAIYRFEIDTTARFDSPLKESIDTLVKGGIVAWKPGQSLAADRVYYWRVALSGHPFDTETPVFSFVYLPGDKSGFNQSHFYQHTQSELKQVEQASHLDWTFAQKNHNIYVAHGVFPNSGTEETHFSVTVNGEMKMRSACIGRSIIFNLFDSLTFQPIRNTPIGSFGSADSCAPFREYNFEFRYYDYNNRKLIMDFLDQIPKGTFVAARLVADRPYDSLFSKYWKADTAIFGSGKSLYHSLLNQGFYDLDSLNRARTFFFMFRKDDSSVFKPYFKFSEGINDRLHASIYPTTIDSAGSISSPWMGPAQKWETANWKVAPPPGTPGTNPYKLQLWGKRKNNQTMLVREFDSYEELNDLSAINAEEFPFLQYRLFTSGNYGDLPVQLRYWRMYFTPLPDGGWSPQDWFIMPKDTLKPSGDTLKLQMAFKNIAATLLDSTSVQIRLRDGQGNETLLEKFKFRKLGPGDTTILNFNKPLTIPEGDYTLLIAVNEAGNPAEQNYFNNRALIPITVSGGTLPIWLLDFNAQKEGKSVKLHWRAMHNEAIRQWDVEHTASSGNFVNIAKDVKPVETARNTEVFLAHHENPEKGNNFYRLKMQLKNGEIKYSDIRKIVFDLPDLLKVAPNPFSSYFYIYPLKGDETWTLTIFDASGRQVKTEKGSGTQRIDLSGSADGIYWLHWTSGPERRIIKMLKQ